MGTVAKVCVGIGLAIAAVYAAVYVGTQISMDTAERRGQAAQEERVKADGDYRLAARDEFYKLCSTVEAQQQEIELLEADAKAATGERKELLESGVTAKRNTMVENAEEYNAKAANEASRGQFRDAELPRELDPLEEEVSCGS